MDNYFTEVIKDENEPQQMEEGGVKRLLIDVAETIILSLVLFLGINAVCARIRVESISMQPTLYEGNFVIVNKVAYRLGMPERGDVVVFHTPNDPTGKPFIKRIIGLPGEEVHVGDGKVYINGTPLREPYIKAAPMYAGTWIVPNGHLFVLGDNRNNSSDSHAWGVVPLENVIGKAEVVYWPPTRWQMLDQAVAAAAED